MGNKVNENSYLRYLEIYNDFKLLPSEFADAMGEMDTGNLLLGDHHQDHRKRGRAVFFQVFIFSHLNCLEPV